MYSIYTDLEKKWLEAGLVDLSLLDVSVSMIYASPSNIFQKKLYVDFNKPFGTEYLAKKLQKAIEIVSSHDARYQLILYDALRPASIQRVMWDAYLGEDRAKYIAAPDRRSMHNYGLAIDVSICDRRDQTALDMGCPIDTFSSIADHECQTISPLQKNNRKVLKETMIQAGFGIYEHEWWHYESKSKRELTIHDKFY
jgi:D-alanyl-D-alanine dipeptidase